MKKSFLASALAVCCIMLSSCGSSGKNAVGDASATGEAAAIAAAEAPAAVLHKYGVKSGIVTFENTGFGLTVKKILYFDDWGTREAEESFDTDGTLKETSLCDGKNIYLLIHKDKAAFNRGECFRGVAYKFDWAEASRGGAEYKPTKLSNQTIAGKDCEFFSLEISGAKTIYAGWNNICFLIETPAMNEKVINKAVSFEENANIPADKFKVPADYKMN
ncbi:MAG: hypothetical protein ACM3UT_09050 [Chloroflexota bacterium]